MKVYLKIYDQYWTGRIRSAKDGSKVYFVLTPRIENAKDLGSEENAMNQLEWWCTQCGADPKEWGLEVEREEKQSHGSCGELPVIQISCDERVYHRNEYIVPNTTDFVWRITGKGEGNTYQKTQSRFNAETKMRSLTDICKTADKYYDNSVELFNLLEEVKSSDLSDVNYSFAIEYINEKIEALKDKLRTRKVRRDFDED